MNAGLAVDSDMLAAQVNLSERQQDRIAAEGDADVAWAELEAAMGMDTSSPRATLVPIAARSFPEGNLAEDIASALKARPDLKALQQQTSARIAAVKSAKDSLAPTVSAYGNWEMDKPDFAGDGGNNWVAGVQLNLDILPLGKRAQLAQAAGCAAEGRGAGAGPGTADSSGSEPRLDRSPDRRAHGGNSTGGDGAVGREPAHPAATATRPGWPR